MDCGKNISGNRKFLAIGTQKNLARDQKNLARDVYYKGFASFVMSKFKINICLPTEKSGLWKKYLRK